MIRGKGEIKNHRSSDQALSHLVRISNGYMFRFGDIIDESFECLKERKRRVTETSIDASK